jgi:hypothetical protein
MYTFASQYPISKARNKRSHGVQYANPDQFKNPALKISDSRLDSNGAER